MAATSKMRTRPMSARRAFTLAELVMVSIILGLIVSAVMEAVHGTRQVVRRVRRYYDAAAHARAALDVMRADFQAAVGLPVGRFTGQSDTTGGPLPGVVSVLAVHKVDPMAGPTNTDVALVEYRLRPQTGEDGPQVLLRRLRPIAPGMPVPPVRARAENADFEGAVPVAARIVALKLRFWDGKQWRDTWAAEQGIPMRIQATLETAAAPGEPPLRTMLDVAIPVAMTPGGGA